MGDRSNIVIQDRGERVYLYGHWMGSRSIGHVVHGLRSGRVRDGSYLARIAFCSMVGADTAGETGYGISASLTDNQHPIVVIESHEEPSVWLEDQDGTRVSRVFTRGEFIERAARSSWRECDPFDLDCDHEAHEWPFAPFLVDASKSVPVEESEDSGRPRPRAGADDTSAL